MRAGALGVAVACALTGCPRLPPPPPRPAVVVERIERGAGGLRARFRLVNRGAAPLVAAAVDWEIVVGGRPQVRGRAAIHRPLAPDERASLDVALLVPPGLPDLPAGTRIELRGMIHLVGPDGGPGAPAPFDDLAAIR